MFMNAPQQVPATGDNPVIPFSPRPVAHVKLRTGFPGATIIVSAQDQPLFAALRDSLFCAVRPKTGVEDEVFRHLLNAAWQLRRLAQWEEELLARNVNPFTDPSAQASLRSLLKYKSALERSYKTALAELRKLQTERLAITQTGELAQAQLSANSPVAAVTSIAKANRAPLQRCIPHPNTLARNARTFFRPPNKFRQEPHPACAAAS
jgi:hypothetical protein